ncbi:hypothetical protein [Paenibacillus sp. PL2-23]|uniref:hypothetical protein n=1 Tax=Paenibacillus sp. PL2-23 TaxID=2100729 RepID=UPI0030FA3C83
MRQSKLLTSIIAGMASGIVLGLFLKAIEELTMLRVYTLLLNVDYIPILKELQLHESVEFLLHLVISLILGSLVGSYASAKHWTRRQILLASCAISVAIALLLYPTTLLSDRTPELMNGEAFFYWLVGHLIYGGALGWFLRKLAPA